MHIIGRTLLLAAVAVAALVIAVIIWAGPPADDAVTRACLEERLPLPSPEAIDAAHRDCLAQQGRRIPSQAVMDLMDRVDRAIFGLFD